MRKEKYISEKVGKKGITLEVKIPYNDPWGDRKIHSKSFNTSNYTTKAEAMRAAKTYRDQTVYQLATKTLPNNKVTVAECYEISKKLHNFTWETTRKYDLRFNLLRKYHNLPISKVTAFDIQLSLNELAEDKTQDVIKSVLTIWRQIYHAAIMSDYVYQDQTIKVTQPKSQVISPAKSVEMHCGLKEVIEAIRTYGKDSFNSNILIYSLIVMAYLGLRPSETYALRKDDIDFTRGIIRINKAIGSTTKERITVKTTKNINSVRELPIPDELVPYLRECMEYQPSEYMFVTKTGKFITTREFSYFIHRACDKANIEFRPYMLRHAFSTKLITSNTDVRTVQELMGHKNMTMTVDYARSSDELKRNAVNTITI